MPARPWFYLLLLAPVAAAQTTQLSGLIQDSSGAAMPAVSVILQNQETGIRRATFTNAEGVYVIPSLQPGLYKITVRKQGFRSLARTGFRLDVGQSARLDFHPQVGSVEEVVTVESPPPWSTGEAGAVGTLVPRAFVDRLPVNGRGLLTLLELSPGLLVTPVESSLEAGQFSVNGLRPNANRITIDGASANFGVQDDSPGSSIGGNLPALSSIGSLHSLVSLAAVEEFRVDVSSTAAENGRFAGAHLALATRSGGNAWHGSLQHFFRNEKLDANNWFSNLSGLPRAPLRWNNPNAVLGGPLVRNRTFLFASYENFRLRQPDDQAIQVPTPAEREAAVSTLQRNFVAQYPQANYVPLPDIGFYLGRTPQPSRLDSASLRIDHWTRANWNLFSRFHAAPSSSRLGSSRGSVRSANSLVDRGYLPLQWIGGVGMAINAATYFDLRLSYSRMSISQTASLLTGDLAALVGETGAGGRSWVLFIGSWSPLESVSGIRRVQSQWQAVPGLSAVRGNHQLKGGGDIRLLRPDIVEPGAEISAFYPTLDAIQQGAGSFAELTRREPLRLRFLNLSVYFQDSWKVHPSVTVNYGLRWEWNPPPVTRDAKPIYGLAGLIDGSGPRLASVGAPVWPRRYRDFAPSLSLAYRMPGGLVLRAGAGIHHSLRGGHVFEALRDQPAFSAKAQYFSVPLSGLASLPLPVLNSSPASTPLLTAYAEDLLTPLTMQNNVTLETSVGRAGTLSAGWVNSLGRRLLRTEFSAVDAASAPFQALRLATSGGSSNYHALQAQFRSGSRKGVQSMAAYAWSHAIDNGSRDGAVQLAAFRKLDRGSADFDARHSLVVAFLYSSPAGVHNWALRGWNLDGFVRARSGFPFNPFVSSWLDEPALPFEPLASRPDYDAAHPVWLADGRIPGGRGLNTEAFPVPPHSRPGTLGRNSIRGFFFHQVDLAVHRSFRIARGPTVLELRAEAFNAFNRPNLNAPAVSAISGGVNPPYFAPNMLVSQFMGRRGTGGDPSTGLLPLFQIGGPRSIQLSVRIAF